MRNRIAYIILTVALLGHYVTYAQDKKIDTVEFNVVSKYKPVITEAEKLNNNPSIADTVKIPRKADYNNLINSQFPTSYTPAPLDAIHMKGEPLDKLYHSYFQGGAGNYNTVYGEYFFNALRSRQFDYGIHLNHLSANETFLGANSTYAFNDINLYGELFIKEHVLYAQADFDNHIVHDYGYDTARAKLAENDVLTRESFNRIGGALDFKSAYKDSSKIGHEINVGYYNFSDVHKAMENNLDFKLHAFTYYEKQRIDVKAMVQYYQDKNSIQDTAHTVNLEFEPYFTTVERHWDARLGAKVDYDAQSKLTAYPDFIARYHVDNDVLMIYAGVDGNKTFDSYCTLAAMNPYIKDTLPLHYTYTIIHIFGGLTGTITPELTYNLSGYQSELKQMPLFVTDTNEQLQNRFTVVYDKVKIINGHADLSYSMKNNLKVTLGADYNYYKPTNQVKVWYHPDFIVNLAGQYTIQSKYIIRAQFYVLGPQYAPVMNEGVVTAKQIALYPDINLGLDYKYNKLFTAFVNLNNIANISYQAWLNYPTQGFNLLVGAKLTF